MNQQLRICILYTVVLLTSSLTTAQTTFTSIDIYPVKSNGIEVKQSWVGGFQAPQFNEIDVDLDGDNDLLIFERYDNIVTVLINENQEYHFDANYSFLFPKLENWVLLRDYNCDGKNDIFTGGQDGVTIYENTSTSNSLNFTLVDTSIRTSDNITILVPSPDLPSIDDIDNDGDLDILTFNAQGEYVTYYKNTAAENGNNCSLEFVIETLCWGDFREDGSFVLGDDCGGNIQSNQQTQSKMHTFSSVLTLDMDNDGDKDLLIGEMGLNIITYLRNGNDSSGAIMDTIIDSFPSAFPTILPHFATPYYLDVNFDGLKDLVVTPNTALSIRNFDNVIDYKNIGSSEMPNFTPNNNSHLTNNILDFGEGSAPSFFDYDLDGDMDLIVGNITYREDQFTGYNGLALLENIDGQYHFIDSNYADIKGKGIFSAQPTFGDLDGDGDEDMLVGDYFGILHFFENIADSVTPANFQLDSSGYANIDVGNDATPFLFDLDGDNDLDLIIGEKNGNINYYENQGDIYSPDFILKTESLGNISTISSISPTEGYSTPKIIDYNRDGKWDLVSGSYDGSIYLYENIYDSIYYTMNQKIVMYKNEVDEQTYPLNFGRRSSPSFVNLNNDTLVDLVIGFFKGGLISLKGLANDTIKDITKHLNETIENFKIYPNPTKSKFSVENITFSSATIKIVDLLGRSLYRANLKKGVNRINAELDTGVYFVVIENGREILKVEKLIISN